MSSRCCVYTNNSNCKLLCKRKFKFIINNKKYCGQHLSLFYKKEILKIQSIYRGYKSRKLINNIYLRLPCDLQRKIIFKVRENFLIKKHHYDVISKTIYNKFNLINIFPNLENIYNMLLDDHFMNYSTTISNFYNKIIVELEYITNIYLLYTKYYDILNKEDNKSLINGNVFYIRLIIDELYHKTGYNHTIINKILDKFVCKFYDINNNMYSFTVTPW